MNQTIQEKNKALVLDAFDTLFNKRDYEAAERYWSPKYIQHSAHIEPGRDGLFNLIQSLPDTLRYEHQLILAEGDYVIVHAASRAMVGPSPGLPRTWSGSRTAVSPNTGTSCKTRRQKPNRKAACRCSATVSRLKFNSEAIERSIDAGGRGPWWPGAVEPARRRGGHLIAWGGALKTLRRTSA